jgi:threonine/homoserine/homoserine lactone efflux protein
MDLGFLYRGLILGFSIAAPVGPIGVLCIRRTLAEGRGMGLASGLGAATADAFYGAVAGFGLTTVSELLVRQEAWLRLLGGLFLCYLGLKTFLTPPAEQAATLKSGGLATAFVSTLALTLTNPMTILSFVAVFAGLGLGTSTGSYSAAGFMVFGVFVGSAIWWLLLTAGVGWFRNRLDPPRLRWVNRISGFVIMGFGLLALLGLKK